MEVKIHMLVCLVVFIYWAECRVIGDFDGGRRARLSLAEPMPRYHYTNIDGHPGTYAFGYDIDDSASGNNQFRNEQRYPNGTVAGSYGYMDANGRPLRFDYVADAKGYRVKQVLRRDPYYTMQDTLQRPDTSNYYITNSIDEQPEVLIINRHSPRMPPAYSHYENTRERARLYQIRPFGYNYHN